MATPVMHGSSAFCGWRANLAHICAGGVMCSAPAGQKDRAVQDRRHRRGGSEPGPAAAAGMRAGGRHAAALLRGHAAHLGCCSVPEAGRPPDPESVRLPAVQPALRYLHIQWQGLALRDPPWKPAIQRKVWVPVPTHKYLSQAAGTDFRWTAVMASYSARLHKLSEGQIYSNM